VVDFPEHKRRFVVVVITKREDMRHHTRRRYLIRRELLFSNNITWVLVVVGLLLLLVPIEFVMGSEDASDSLDESVSATKDTNWVGLTFNAIMSAGFAGLVAVGVTVAIERLGGTLGGVLGTLPTTVVPASIGLTYQAENLTRLWQVLFLLPVNMTLATAFLYMWRVIPPYLPSTLSLGSLVLMMLVISVTAWAIEAICMYFVLRFLLGIGVSVTVLGIGATLGLFCVGLLSACVWIVPAPKGHRKVSLGMYLARALLAAIAIGVGVVLSLWSEFLAALATTFPAIFLTSMVGLWISQGRAVPSGAVGPMMLGVCSVAVYAMLYAVLYCYSAGVSLPIYYGLRWRRSCVQFDEQTAEKDAAVIEMEEETKALLEKR
jgi:hypothetical protein